MARQWRIEYPGAFYHILSRGNERQEIFRSDDDREMFIDLIGEFSDRFQIDMIAYVLMGNHYHLLIKTPNGNLAKSMQWLGTAYTRKFNNRHGRNGHLFQGRYKSILVENESYLLRLSCYIHRNPLRAGIVNRLANYPWSSYLSYGYARKTPEWLKTELILNVMPRESDPHQRYRSMVQQYSDEAGSIWEDVQHGLIFGSQDFVADIRSRFLSGDKDPELPQYNRMAKALSPNEILKSGSKALGFDVEAAAEHGRRIPASDKDKRDLLIYLLWESGGLTNQEIGACFGLTYSAVSRRVGETKKRLKQEKELMDRWVLLKSQIKV
jgi:REP element-mobilizing transposase RayT